MSGETKQKGLLESIDSASEKIDTVIKTTNATFGWIESIHKFIAKHGIKKLFMDLMLVGVVIMGALAYFPPGILVERMEKYKDEKHEARKELRLDNTPKVQEELDRFRQQYNVSWAAVWELHNNTNNLDGLPFLFASLTYESMSPALTPIAEQFDNVRLSLYPLSTYLSKNELWCGEVDSLQVIDNSAYHRAKALNIKYLGFKTIEINGEVKFLLSAAFVDGCETPDFELLKKDCVYTSYKIGSLLSINSDENKSKRKKK